jgi:acetyl-CoA acetyltransferase
MKSVIAAYARSPLAFAKKGALAGVRPDTLGAQVVQGLLQRIDLDPALIEDVILGCAYPEAAQGNNLARIVGLLAGHCDDPRKALSARRPAGHLRRSHGAGIAVTLTLMPVRWA